MRLTALNVINNSCHRMNHKTGRYVPARPERDTKLWQRIKDAWGVLTGKLDALDWENE